MAENVHLLAIAQGMVMIAGPATCASQSLPTCDDAVAMMAAAEELTLGDTWWESDPTAAGFVGPPTMFKVAAADRMIIETEAVDSMDTYLQLFSADGLKGDHNDDYNGLNSRIDLDNSRVRPSECIESWGDYEGMVCDADGTEREATCQRVVSESDLTAASDGVLLCIGPQLSEDWIYFAVHHYPDWDATGRGNHYKVRVTNEEFQEAQLCATGEDVHAGACATQATCETQGHEWWTGIGCVPRMPCTSDQFTCTDGTCIRGELRCNGLESLGNGPGPADCPDGSDEVAANCVGEPAYTCQPGGRMCDTCTDAMSCVAADCDWTVSNDPPCGRRARGRTADPDCVIPPSIMDVCITDYCTAACNTALTAWWNEDKHSNRGSCASDIAFTSIPAEVAQVRAFKQACNARVGCPGIEIRLGMEDTFGDGWHNGGSSGHAISVKRLGAAPSDDVTLDTRTLVTGYSGSESVCIREQSSGGFGCLAVELDSSADCEAQCSCTCWSDEVTWTMHVVDPVTGIDELVVSPAAGAAMGSPGRAGYQWTNLDASCPVAPATTTSSLVASEQGRCAVGEKECADGHGCIREDYLCDGSVQFGNAMWGADCADSSDENWQWCIDADLDVAPSSGVYRTNLARACTGGESHFSCDSMYGCSVSGCGACGHCDDSEASCLVEPAACIASGCVWSDAACEVPAAGTSLVSGACAGLQLSPSCAEAADSSFCSEACYDSLQAISDSCLAEYQTVGGVSAEWVAQVNALKAGACATRGCTGAANTLLRIQLRDSWGDGWSGNMMSVTTTDTSDVSDESQYTLDQGEAEDIEMCVDSTATKCVTVSVDASGEWPDEVTWSVKDAETGEILTPRASMAANANWQLDTTSDSSGCGAAPTPSRSFRCGNGDLVDWSKLCDGTDDCRRGEDEAGGGLASFCGLGSTRASCAVLAPQRVGDGWCDRDTAYDTAECGYDGGDCSCWHDYDAVKSACSFTGDTPPSGRCVDFGTCASGSTTTTAGVTTTVPGFAAFYDTCFTMFDAATYASLGEFAFTCAPTFTCRDGSQILLENQCNGWKDCSDGSDEGFAQCGSDYQYGSMGGSFRCIDGTMIDAASECNGVCNCGNSVTGMCEDEHPIRGDTTCAASECARRSAAVLEMCGGVWPASWASGVQKATCGSMCAPLLTELYADPSCSAHRPTGLDGDANRLCEYVEEHHHQPVTICRNASGITIPISPSQVCDQVSDCETDIDEGGRTPTCPYLLPTVTDCNGVPRDPSMLDNGICDKIDPTTGAADPVNGEEVFNCAALDFDNGACRVEVTIEAVQSIGGSVSTADFIAALADANPLVDAANVVVCPTCYTETTTANVQLPLQPSMLDTTDGNPAAVAATEQVVAGICTLLSQPNPCPVELQSEGKAEDTSGRRRLQTSGTSVQYTVTSSEPVSGTMGADDYAASLAAAINAGGAALPTIDPASVESDVASTSTEINYVVMVDSDSLEDESVTSTADASAALGDSLQASLTDTTAMRAALVANGASICASCRIGTETLAVQSNENLIAAQAASAAPAPPAGPPPPPNDGCEGDECEEEEEAAVDVCLGGMCLTQEEAGSAMLLIIGAAVMCILFMFLGLCWYFTKKASKAATTKASQAHQEPQMQQIQPPQMQMHQMQQQQQQQMQMQQPQLLPLQQQPPQMMPPAMNPAAQQHMVRCCLYRISVLETCPDDRGVLACTAAGSNAWRSIARPAAGCADDAGTGPPSAATPISHPPPAHSEPPWCLQHLGAMGVTAPEYIQQLQEEGFDTPGLFDTLTLEELANDFGFKRGHLRAVENWRAGAGAPKQAP